VTHRGRDGLRSHQARQHLGNLFDAPDYDIACVLLPLSWWSRLYSENFAEGAPSFSSLSLSLAIHFKTGQREVSRSELK